MAETERTMEEWEQLLVWAEDRREIKNVMGKFSNSILLCLDAEADALWSKRDDICLGLNNGWYIGKEEVQRYFSVKRSNILKKAEVLIKIFPDKLGKDTKPEELYGIGMLEEKPMGSPVIEIASDRQTAKGVWYSQGSYTDITSRGPLGQWTYGNWGVDFIFEDGEWKIWHALYLEDIKGPVSTNAAMGDYSKFPELPEFEELQALKDAEPTKAVVLREYYSAKRPFSKLIDVPEKYDTFADTFTYGYKED